MLNEATLNAIRAAAGIDGVSTRETDRIVYGADLWPRLNIHKLQGRTPEYLPDAVVWPRTVEAVAGVLSVCSEEGIPVIPYGGGSGVCGGTVPVQGGVILDLKRINRIRELDELSMAVDVEAGMIGQHLETALNERGYTLGHFPSSIMCSTVGGWVATRSAGQFSSRYGKIEDMVIGMDVCLPDGSVVSVDGTQSHHDFPGFTQLFLGSEGTLGVVISVKLRVFPAPSTRRFGGFRFMDMVAGLEAMRSIMQHGLRPVVMRLYDPLDTLINNFSMSSGEGEGRRKELDVIADLIGKTLGVDLGDLASALTGPLLRRFLAHPGAVQHLMDLAPLSSLLVIGFEGDSQRTSENIAEATELAKRATGHELGPGPGEHWFEYRYSVSFKLSKVFGQGAFAETIEVAGLWKDVPDIYMAVRTAVMNHVSVMAHFSHAYREGCALYFTFSGYASGNGKLLELYDRVVRKALSAAMGAGATVSHHHGIGMMKRTYTPEEYRGGERLYWAIKQSVDPKGIMNPQKVYPPTVPVERPADLRPGGYRAEFDTEVSYDHMVRGSKVVIPDVPEEIPEILRIAASTGQKLACQGMATPDEPGSSVSENGHSIDLSRMDEIIDMDPVSGSITVQAGMTVLQLENFLREKGFTLGFAPRSRLLLGLGEYLATASPGEGSPLYGTTFKNCLGLSATLADGTKFSVRPCPRRSAGPGLMHCLLGARGRYGVITAACMRVFPVPTVREAIAFASDDPVVAVSAVRTILVRQARPEWILLVIRSPRGTRGRKRIRVVFQFGGDSASVSFNLALVRSVMESLGMEGESVSAEDRMSPRKSGKVTVERFLSMDAVMRLASDLTEIEDASCPEVHILDIAPQGATMRLLLRHKGHEFPQGVLDELRTPDLHASLLRAADSLKDILDPEGLLNG